MLNSISQETLDETVSLYNLQEWLLDIKQNRGGDAKIGITRQSDSCPLATYLLDKFPQINNDEYRVEVDLFTISIFNKALMDSDDEGDYINEIDDSQDVKDKETGSVFITTPVWAKTFIKSVDVLPDIRNLYQHFNTGEIITFKELDSKPFYEFGDWATMELIPVTVDDGLNIVKRIIDNESDKNITE